MIRMKQVMAIARAQRLIDRRLVRYWVFMGLAYFVTLLIAFNNSLLHASFSSYSGSVGVVSPRFLMSTIGMLYTLIFLVGTVFLAIDVRARDRREGVLEALDSRPYNNLELMAGRFLGVFLSSWIPMVVLATLFQAIGFLLKGLDIPFGETMEIFSLFSFVIVTAVPALSFVIALVFFITLLVRNRLAAVVILLIVIGISYWATFSLPMAHGMLFDIIGVSSMDFASDIVPHLKTAAGWLQRLSVLFAAFGLLGLSAAIHPRLDSGSRKKPALVSLVTMVAAFALAGSVYFKNTGDFTAIEIWKQAHAYASNEVLPDLRKIKGDVKISPGKDLHLELDVTFAAPKEMPLQKALFTLNPGQEVTEIVDAMENPISFTHENGLLELTPPKTLGPGEETTVHLVARGEPDNRFAFLYSDTSPMTSTLSRVRLLALGGAGTLGVDAGVFNKNFVALMPGLRWLPVSGSEKGRDDTRVRSVDYFDLDLKVDLPEGWLAAGPGRRNIVTGNDHVASFRFSPPAPVPDAGLIASRFESRSMEVEGVGLEILLSKKHLKNLNLLADTKENIREWVGYHLREAKVYGLSYPYDAITLVEVPNTLRSYGGGWRMDTTLAPPSLLLLREMGFPTANFDFAFRSLRTEGGKGIQQAKLERLKLFFSNDFSGGNILAGASKNFFLYQTAAHGPDALALNYLLENLSNQVITETKSYYSAHQLLNGDGLEKTVIISSHYYESGRSRKTSIVDVVSEDSVSKPEVWESALGISLDDMDPWEDPARTVDVLNLKTDAIVRSILDTLGRDKTVRLLASVRRSHKGASFSLNDFIEAGKALGKDLTESLADKLSSTDLPGFICEEADIYRITDSGDMDPRYQLLFKVRNDEVAPGCFRFVYEYAGGGEKTGRIESAPIHMPGKSIVQFGTIVSRPPASVYLEPYLSLNRGAFKLRLNRQDEGKILKVTAIEELKMLPYANPQDVLITVDDLDTGFSVTEVAADNGIRINTRKNAEMVKETGLQIARDFIPPPYWPPSFWTRVEHYGSYGKYRHTVAVVRGGEGEKRAVFKTNITKSGQWDLELHVPAKWSIAPGARKWGTFHMAVTGVDGDMHEFTFDSQTATQGWNLVKSIELSKGETTVTISNKTDGDFVVSDAIRWLPSAGK